MKKIKNYIKNLPKVIKIIILINLLFYVISLVSATVFNFDINYYLAFHPTHTNEFQINQLFTFMFTHDYFPSHIIINLFFLFLFSVSFAKKFGTKNYILMYMFSSIIGVISYNSLQNYQNKIYKEELLNMGIQPKKFDSVETNHINNKSLYKYNQTFFSAVGSSASVCGFIVSFIIFNIRSIKKLKNIILYIVSLFILYYISIPFVENKFDDFATQIGHVGGLLGGLIFSIHVKIKKEV